MGVTSSQPEPIWSPSSTSTSTTPARPVPFINDYNTLSQTIGTFHKGLISTKLLHAIIGFKEAVATQRKTLGLPLSDSISIIKNDTDIAYNNVIGTLPFFISLKMNPTTVYLAYIFVINQLLTSPSDFTSIKKDGVDIESLLKRKAYMFVIRSFLANESNIKTILNKETRDIMYITEKKHIDHIDWKVNEICKYKKDDEKDDTLINNVVTSLAKIDKRTRDIIINDTEKAVTYLMINNMDPNYIYMIYMILPDFFRNVSNKNSIVKWVLMNAQTTSVKCVSKDDLTLLLCTYQIIDHTGGVMELMFKALDDTLKALELRQNFLVVSMDNRKN